MKLKAWGLHSLSRGVNLALTSFTWPLSSLDLIRAKNFSSGEEEFVAWEIFVEHKDQDPGHLNKNKWKIL
jgi:hypothetical protein